MICNKCGALLPENAAFCENCGAAVESSQPDYSQPVRYTAQPAPAAAPAKKRSKLVPGICIAAGAAVALGGTGAVVYNTNRASINRLLMGDANYAYSVAMKAASSVTSSVEGVSPAVNAMMKTSMNNTAVADAVGLASDAANGELTGSDLPDTDDALAAAATAMEMGAVYINEMTGMSGAEVTMSGSLELSDSVKELILDSAGGVIDSTALDNIVGALNTTVFTTAEKDSGSAYEYMLDLTSGGDSIVSAQLRYEKDGTFTMVFPGISDTGFTAQLPAASAGKQTADITKFDLMQLYTEITAGFRSELQKYDIQYTAGESRVGNLTFNGLNMEMTLGADELADMIMVVADAIEGDEEFEKYLEALDSSSSLDEIVEKLEEGADELRELNSDLTTKLIFYINTDDTLAGGRLTLINNGYSMDYAVLSGGNDYEATFTVNGTEYFAVHSKGTSKTDGRVEFDFSGLMQMLLTRSESITTDKYALYMDYTGAGTAEIFGIPTSVGTYKLSLSSGVAGLLSGGDVGIKQTIEQSSITVSMQPQGKGVVCSCGADVSGYGRCELVLTLDEPKGEVAPKPDDRYKLVDINDAEEAADALTVDLMAHISDLSSNKLVGTIVGLVSGGSMLYDEPNTGNNFQYFTF
ncbi:MAG: zinc ribbon domain-containing protein [Oscillospiraceae bacterium]